MKLLPLILCSLSLAGCEQTFNLSQPTAPTSPGSTVSVTNTNTNTATNNNNPDKTGSDTGSPTSPDTSGASGVIPLPAYGEDVVRSVASNNATLLANSCQVTHGESAWAFLDLAIRTLQVRDTRWGYLCKNAECSAIARDIVAYRASTGNTGIWIVDVIGNHCPAPSDVVTVTWQTLPFETTRPWIGVRR